MTASAVRVSPAWSDVPNLDNVPIRLMATPAVAVQPAALRQAAQICRLHRNLAVNGGRVRDMVLTPDLHPGAGIPVGAVVDTEGGFAPGLIGSDIGCGMRLLITDLTPADLDGLHRPLRGRLRQLFFAGARKLALTADSREAVLRGGLRGLLAAQPAGGLWDIYQPREQQQDLAAAHRAGSLPAGSLFDAFAGWVRRPVGHDGQLGSLGGGNHFAEIGRVEQIHDPAAGQWGVSRDRISVMIHTGSLGFGRSVAAAFCDPRDPLRALHGAAAGRYLDAMRQAANFAFVNRLVLGLMMIRALQDVTGRTVRSRLVGDAPHNLIGAQPDGSFRHRKGATPADGPDAHRWTGQPVIIPGSMGDRSWLLAGHGNEQCLSSTSHGAGRAVSRRRAARADSNALTMLQVVTPVDPEQLAAAGRRDLIRDHQARLREEAPGAYKPVGPVIDSVTEAGAARKVACLQPIITVKG